MSNPMREIVLDKVTINIGVGEGGEKLKKAERVINILTGRTATTTNSKSTIRDFGIRKNQPLGVKVTLRKKPAEEFLQRALWVKDFKVPSYSFDISGNLSFGIKDYTTFEKMKYDPEIGIFGMDINVVLKRKGGKRVAERKTKRGRIPNRHRITKEEAMEYLRNKFNLKVIEVKI